MGNRSVKLSDKLRTLFFVSILTFGGFFIAYLSEHEQAFESSVVEGMINKLSYLFSGDELDMAQQSESTIDVERMSTLLANDHSLYESKKDSLFNQQVPDTSDGVEFSNQVVSSNSEEQSQQISSLLGWETEPSWTGYHLSEVSNGLQVDYEKTASYGYMSMPFLLTLNEGELTNAVALKFENINLSVERISFYLQGDVKLLLEDESPLYYREKIGEYVRGSSSIVQMSFDVNEALDLLAGHMDGGVSLVMMIDSDSNYNYEDQVGSLIIYDAVPIRVSYANNTIRPWQVNGQYELVQDNYQTRINYNGIENFSNVSALVLNHQELCHWLNLELKNIDYSVEHVTVNVYGANGEVATMTIDLSEYKKEAVSVKYDLLEYNSKIGRVSKVELLIDSNPYLEQHDRNGSLEVVSISFSQN